MTNIITSDEAREIAAAVARSIREACGRLLRGDVSADRFEAIEDACDAAVDAAMTALANSLMPVAPRIASIITFYFKMMMDIITKIEFESQIWD